MCHFAQWLHSGPLRRRHLLPFASDEAEMSTAAVKGFLHFFMWQPDSDAGTEN